MNAAGPISWEVDVAAVTAVVNKAKVASDMKEVMLCVMRQSQFDICDARVF
jgi:hypothetical protein